MSKNPFPWDLPAGTWDGDPKAPWNQSDDHCPNCCPYADGAIPEAACTECEQEYGEGLCYLYDWLPHRVALWLVIHFGRFLKGLADSHCNFKDPECKCGDCDCDNEPDWDAIRDERRDREFDREQEDWDD